MLIQEIQTELDRLQIHPVNLHASAGADGQVVLAGSLLPFWKAPAALGGAWLLARLKELPAKAGPQATMDALFTARGESTKA